MKYFLTLAYQNIKSQGFDGEEENTVLISVFEVDNHCLKIFYCFFLEALSTTFFAAGELIIL
jgi:hypothetical protein